MALAIARTGANYDLSHGVHAGSEVIHMVEVLRENSLYSVELEKDDHREHHPHKSWGSYRVIDRTNARVLFTTRNRDKSLGVFEYITLGAQPV